jgi:hypothetical protein
LHHRVVKCVVPSITTSIACAGTPDSVSAPLSDSLTPLITSGDVGALKLAITRSPSMITASVLVPPTSMPILITVFFLNRLQSNFSIGV